MALRARDLGRTYTPQEFEQMPEFNERYELINGRLVEKPMPVFEHSEIAYLIMQALWDFDRLEKLGLMRAEVRMRRKNGDFLIPDLSYWIANRRPARNVPTPTAPDLAVEIQSPDQSLSELADKAQALLAEGVRVVWLIQPNKTIAAVFRQGQSQPQTIPPEGFLEANEVIPGFQLPLKTLFP